MSKAKFLSAAKSEFGFCSVILYVSRLSAISSTFLS